MMNRIHLLVCVPDLTDATSLYRGFGPLMTLKRQFNFLEIEHVTQGISWATLKGVDAVFIQRPHTEAHAALVRMCKSNRKPVWLDFDDDLYNVPRDNPAYRIYKQASVQQNMTEMICLADFVSVSTAHLQKHLQGILRAVAGSAHDDQIAVSSFNPDKIRVLPNAYDEDIMTSIAKLEHDQNAAVAWRGSASHDKDLYQVAQDLRHAAQVHKSWVFNFIGSPFWLAMENVKKGLTSPERIVESPAMDAIEYLKFLHVTRPAVMIVPLVDCPFNHAKSNIAWIEATHAGAICIAPDFPEWRRPGILNYKTLDQFFAVLNRLMSRELDTHKLYADSVEYISAHLRLSKVNEKRMAMLIEMTSGHCNP